MKLGRWLAVGLGLLVACGPLVTPDTPQVTLFPSPTSERELRPSSTLPATWTPTPAASPHLVSVATVTAPMSTNTPSPMASLWSPDEIPAVTLTPTRAAAVSAAALQYLTRAQDAFEDGQLDKALELVDQALELEPENSPMWAFRGQVNAQLERPLSAEQDLKQALTLDPFLTSARLALAQLYVDYARWTAAGDELTRYLQLVPGDLDTRLELGIVHESQGHPLAAIEIYSDTLALDPANAPALMRRGALWLQAGQLELAWNDLSAALELSPSEEAYLQRAQISRAWDAPLQAAADLRDSLIFVEDDDLRYSRLLSAGQAYLDGEAGEDALLMYTEALSLTHGVDAMLGLGESYLTVGAYESAFTVFSETLATAGPWEVGPALSGRGQAHAGMGSWQDALADFDGALAADMGDEMRAKVYGRRAAVHAVLEEWEPAVADWSQAYRLSMDPQYLYRRGMAYLEMEELVLAEEDLANYVAAAGEAGGNPEWLQAAKAWLATLPAEEP